MSGVYLICNTITGDFYIGSTVRKITHRWSGHMSLLTRNKHHSPHMQRSWNKYGHTAFAWVILEECSNVLEREQYYFDTYNPTFNIAKVAGNTTGVIFSAERRAKISRALKGRSLGRRRPRTVTQEQMREYHKQYMRKYRANYPRKTREEMSKIHQDASAKKKLVERNDGLTAKSVREMARIMNIGHSEIVRAIKRNLRVRGYSFKYLDTQTIQS